MTGFSTKKHLLLCVLTFDFSQTVFWEGGIKKTNTKKPCHIKRVLFFQSNVQMDSLTCMFNPFFFPPLKKKKEKNSLSYGWALAIVSIWKA